MANSEPRVIFKKGREWQRTAVVRMVQLLAARNRRAKAAITHSLRKSVPKLVARKRLSDSETASGIIRFGRVLTRSVAFLRSYRGKLTRLRVEILAQPAWKLRKAARYNVISSAECL